MPKLRCPNGHVIDLSAVPAPGEYFYRPTAGRDELVEEIVAAVRDRPADAAAPLDETVSDALAGLATYFYACGVCGSLVFPAEAPPRGYTPSTPRQQQDGDTSQPVE